MIMLRTTVVLEYVGEDNVHSAVCKRGQNEKSIVLFCQSSSGGCRNWHFPGFLDKNSAKRKRTNARSCLVERAFSRAVGVESHLGRVLVNTIKNVQHEKKNFSCKSD